MKTVLVTGANRGLGLEFVKQFKAHGYHVLACCRNPDEAPELQAIDGIECFALDVTDDKQIAQLKEQLAGRPIDLLINNAGLIGDDGVTVGNIERDNFLHVIDVNCLSPLKLADSLLDNVKASTDKCIVNISSAVGSITDNQRGRTYAYRTSKAALHCAMRSFAIDVEPLGINVMLLHPGWVTTRLGGPNALIDVEESVSGMLQQIEQHKQNSHAEVLRRFDGGTMPW